MNDVTLVTAGLGDRKWGTAARRLGRQARASGWFSNIECIDNGSAQTRIPEFFTENAEFLSRNPRGYGYWLWRIYLLRRVLRELPKGSIAVFLDAGCELNINPSSHTRLKDYCEMAAANGLCVMRTRHLLAEWCKGDTLEAFGIPISASVRTVEPGVLFAAPTIETMDLVDAWLDWARRDDYHHLDDSPSVIANAPSFIEHRHDQSILTALTLNRSEIAIEQETDFSLNDWRSDGAHFPVWAVRNQHALPLQTGGSVSSAMRWARRMLRVIK